MPTHTLSTTFDDSGPRQTNRRRLDLIVLLEGGRLVDQGTHDELLQHSDRYRQMVFLQVSGEKTAVATQ